MDKRLILAYGVCLAITAALAKDPKSDDLIRVKQSGAMVYTAEASGSGDTVGSASAGAEVQMFKQGKARSLVKTSDNLKGWVDNSALERIKGGGSSHNLKDIQVQGWLDNPSAVYILDQTNPDISNLPLDRNFASDIVEKKDREDVERSYDENK